MAFVFVFSAFEIMLMIFTLQTYLTANFPCCNGKEYVLLI